MPCLIRIMLRPDAEVVGGVYWAVCGPREVYTYSGGMALGIPVATQSKANAYGALLSTKNQRFCRSKRIFWDM